MTITATDPTLSTPDRPGCFADVEVNFARTLPGYEARPQQQKLAKAIEDAIGSKKHLFAQAGCGTGKSLGGVTPMILAAVRDGKRAVVATATKALQEQYAGKDLPFIQANSGIPFTWALLKGRSNYVCHAKLASDEAALLTATAMIKAELEDDPEHSGDFEHFSQSVDPLELSRLSTGSNECPGKMECPFGEICFAEKAKEAAREADLVVTNTAMFMTDRVIVSKTADRDTGPVEMLGQYDLLLLDEGHELPEIAANNLGFDFTAQGIANFARDAVTWAALQGVDVSASSDAIGNALQILDPVARSKGGESVNLAWFVDNYVPFMDVCDEVRNLRTAILGISVSRDRDAQETKRKMLTVRSQNIIENLSTMVSAPDHEQVRWVEIYETHRGESRWKMRTAPVDIAPFMQAWVWDSVETAVLMSATLSSGVNRDGSKDFTYMKRALGLWDAFTVDVGTPFDLNRQGLMYVPKPTIASPKSNYGAWMTFAGAVTMELIEASKGGALLLFTSRTAMKAAHASLAGRLEDSGYTVLMQGDGRTNKELARVFKEDTHSILFALKSFFVGVDIPGDALRLVVLDKLPFPVPSDPRFKALSLKEENEGRRSFASLSIPMMILTLEQAIGRLIRTKTDQGVVAVLDSRLSSERYGREIVSALPDFPVTVEVSKVREFFAA
jgi:ATP-dependent DNA helicase DinG